MAFMASPLSSPLSHLLSLVFCFVQSLANEVGLLGHSPVTADVRQHAGQAAERVTDSLAAVLV